MSIFEEYKETRNSLLLKKIPDNVTSVYREIRPRLLCDVFVCNLDYNSLSFDVNNIAYYKDIKIVRKIFPLYPYDDVTVVYRYEGESTKYRDTYPEIEDTDCFVLLNGEIIKGQRILFENAGNLFCNILDVYSIIRRKEGLYDTSIHENGVWYHIADKFDIVVPKDIVLEKLKNYSLGMNPFADKFVWELYTEYNFTEQCYMPHLEDYLKRIIGEVVDIFLDNVVDETYNVNKDDFSIYFDNDIYANPFIQYLTYGNLSERKIGHTFSLSAKEPCSLKISNLNKMREFKERFDIFNFEFDSYRDIEVNLILSDKEYDDLFIKTQTVTFLSDSSTDRDLKISENFALYCDICVIDSYNSCNLAGYPQIKDKLIIINSEDYDKDYFHLSKENYIIQGRNEDLSIFYNGISVNDFLEDINMREFRWTNQYVQELNKTIKQITYAQK